MNNSSVQIRADARRRRMIGLEFKANPIIRASKTKQVNLSEAEGSKKMKQVKLYRLTITAIFRDSGSGSRIPEDQRQVIKENLTTFFAGYMLDEDIQITTEFFGTVDK